MHVFVRRVCDAIVCISFCSERIPGSRATAITLFRFAQRFVCLIFRLQLGGSRYLMKNARVAIAKFYSRKWYTSRRREMRYIALQEYERDKPRRAERIRDASFSREVHRDYVMSHCFEIMSKSYKNARETRASKKIYVPRVTVTMRQTQFLKWHYVINGSMSSVFIAPICSSCM